MNKKLYYSGIVKESIVDGSGIRTTIFFSGCKHGCKNCHNVATWNFAYGEEFTKEIEDKIFDFIKTNVLIKGITLSGGDPCYSAELIIPFVKRFKERFPEKDIWLYTGFSIEDLDEKQKELINLCNMVVDGLYIEELNDKKCMFRGSSNQKIYKITSKNVYEDVSNEFMFKK